MHKGYHRQCASCRAYNVAEVDRIIFDIKMQMAKPNYKPQTSSEMRLRANRLRDMATSIKIQGGRIKESYQ